MKKKTKKAVIGIGVVLAVVIGLFGLNTISPGQYDSFASCIADSGAQFYGAFWCPNCNDQKQLFGKSQKKLPYVECSPSSRQGQLPVCVEAGIDAYPTWEFADDERMTGLLSFETLAEKTGCIAPE